MEDLIEQANEVQEMLGRSYAVPDELDEADLEAGMYKAGFWVRYALNRDDTELDALALEEEEEGTSYLSDLNKVPDFVDEPPVETHEVSIHSTSDLWRHKVDGHLSRVRRRRQSRQQAKASLHINPHPNMYTSLQPNCTIDMHVHVYDPGDAVLFSQP